MKKLFLASWFAGSYSLLSDFVSEDMAGKKVVFIPTAIGYKMPDEERAGYNFINGLDRDALVSLGFVIENLEVETKTAKEIEESLLNADAVFVCGGSTFYLMQELKRKGADKMIARHIEEGKLYIGTSAGSVIAQKEFVTDDPNDDPKYGADLNGSYTGLGIIDFYLYVHYGRHYFGDDDEFYNKYYAHLNCVKIDDNEAVTVKGDKVEVVSAPVSCIPTLPATNGC